MGLQATRLRSATAGCADDLLSLISNQMLTELWHDDHAFEAVLNPTR
jgi:hypothetical protein